MEEKGKKEEEETTTMVKIVKCLGRSGSRGSVTQARVEFMDGTKRTLVRNIKGPCREGDIIVLMECEREARRLR